MDFGLHTKSLKVQNSMHRVCATDSTYSLRPEVKRKKNIWKWLESNAKIFPVAFCIFTAIGALAKSKICVTKCSIVDVLVSPFVLHCIVVARECTMPSVSLGDILFKFLYFVGFFILSCSCSVFPPRIASFALVSSS